MVNKIIENALIRSVSITMEDHGIITFLINVEGDAWGCSVGGYCIGHGYLNADKDYFDGCGEGIEAMARIMDVVGVSRWEDLKGKYCRIERICEEGIIKIGHIIKDKWFDIDQFFKEKQNDK